MERQVAVGSTTVRLAAIAVAVAGMPQVPVTGKLRDSPVVSGPPWGPAGRDRERE